MNATLLELLLQQAASRGAGAVAARLGIDEQTARRAIAAALPLIVGALARNASTPGGAASLNKALATRHDGSLLDSAVDFLAGGDLADGNAILGHIFGKRRGDVVETVARASELDTDRTAELFAMLAPLVMAYLGRQRTERGLDEDGLADLLEQRRAEIEDEDADPATGGSVFGQLAESLLRRRTTGDASGTPGTDAAVKIGVDLLGQLLRGRQG